MNKFQGSLQKYLDVYANQESYFITDIRSLEFYRANPTNTNFQDVRQKLSVIDDPDFSKLEALDPMTEHILTLKVDSRLAKKDFSLVEDIARITLQGRQERLLPFASVFCNLHLPDVFPIYSVQFLDFYRTYIREYKLALNPDELNNYDVFANVQDDLLSRYGLKGKLNYLQVRKFAWAYADKVLGEIL